METKTAQLQIRISPQQKRALKILARKTNLDMSEWILTKILPPQKEVFHSLVRRLAHGQEPRFVLAELNEFLTKLSAQEFTGVVEDPPRMIADPYWLNYLAAMLEYAAQKKGIEPPHWLSEIPPLLKPVFGSDLESLRLHLLTQALPSFRRRNIFIDASLGDQI
ncbi:MAG: hypothetical protein HYU97_00930 [Deltaproteobacteria bacterium]|nr:hypothetical protein [Deltaproteobacteria bacterium]